MYIKSLELNNYRNYSSLNISFEKGTNILYGNNAQGKTNILEAISFLSQGRGLRSARLSEVKTFDFFIRSMVHHAKDTGI